MTHRWHRLQTRFGMVATRKEVEHMTDKKVWFITGAGRGMDVDFAKAALAAGNAVTATGITRGDGR
jgi:hypothetical protein